MARSMLDFFETQSKELAAFLATNTYNNTSNKF